MNLPVVPSSQLAMSPRYPAPGHMHQRSLPRAGKLPVSGYEALASALSTTHSSPSTSTSGPSIPPIYRKFSALNHRLLLHLQDELSELEEQLHRLDSADTASRSLIVHSPQAQPESDDTPRIIPASRRASAHAGGELEWHKADLVARIAHKLNQYNAALTSFNSLSSSFPAADEESISRYRHYLEEEKPVVDSETKFLDHDDDLVSVCGSTTTTDHPTTRNAPSTLSCLAVERIPTLPSLAMAIAAAVLIPILTFSVIPGFLGRMTVVLLVALGVLGAMVQSGVPASKLVDTEGLMCGAVYAGCMIVLAGIAS
jgi:hypothetical protein